MSTRLTKDQRDVHVVLRAIIDSCPPWSKTARSEREWRGGGFLNEIATRAGMTMLTVSNIIFALRREDMVTRHQPEEIAGRPLPCGYRPGTMTSLPTGRWYLTPKGAEFFWAVEDAHRI
jgi:hypothetical protein